MKTRNRVQILKVAVCTSHSVNTLGKCINSTFLPSGMGKIVGQTRPFSLGMATSLGKGKLDSKLTLCRFLLVQRFRYIHTRKKLITDNIASKIYEYCYIFSNKHKSYS